MRVLSHADAFEVLLLHAQDEGRASVLFGESLQRVRTASRPFMVGDAFPCTYLEFPLMGSPFLDVTVLYGRLGPGTHIESPALCDAGGLLDWFSKACCDYDNLSLGFELDMKGKTLPQAAVHFQPFRQSDLVVPFCEAAGEPERAKLYLDLAARMPRHWPLSYLGLFRGRPGSPLRACGYLGMAEKVACAHDPSRLARAFDKIGFSAYDDMLLVQAAELMALAPGGLDFQFDVYPDGHLGTTFAIESQLEIHRPEVVRAAFSHGPVADIMDMLEAWGVADERRHLVAGSAFARAIPVELEDGTFGKYAFTLMPQWVKVRWSDDVLQPSKLYLYAHAGLLGGKSS